MADITAIQSARVLDNGTSVDADTALVGHPFITMQGRWDFTNNAPQGNNTHQICMLRFGPFSTSQILTSGSLRIAIENNVVITADMTTITMKIESSPNTGDLSNLETGSGNIDEGPEAPLFSRLYPLITVGTITLTTNITAGDTFTGTFTVPETGAAIHRNAWDGNVNILLVPAYLDISNPNSALTYAIAGPASTNGASAYPQLTLNGQATNTSRRQTGISGPDQAWSRADECPVCGFISLRETWVRDPNRNILVCPQCRDDLDPDPRPPVHERPGINEGG